MNKTQHKSNNRVLGAPNGWDQNAVECGALPITDCDFEGVPAVASYWRPTAEELKALNDGGLVVLFVLGRTMPPVAIDVTNE